MNLRHFFLVALGFVILGSCSTYSKKQCEEMNWRMVGYNQGVDGHPSTIPQYEHYQKYCGESYGIFPDQSEMNLGYQDGLNLYCSPQGARRAGSSGMDYQKVCPLEKEPDFLKVYNGERFLWLEKEVIRLRTEIKNQQSLIQNLQSENSNLQIQMNGVGVKTCP